MNPHPMDMNLAVQNAKTKADHEALEQHYEQAAKKCSLKLMGTRNCLVSISQQATATVDRRMILWNIL
jgi:hypothetical protein